VPDDGRFRAPRGSRGGEPLHLFATERRQRAPRVLARTNRLAVMDEKQAHAL
jgi:hypothetical protein